jgi:uncharacterized protein DUF3987
VRHHAVYARQALRGIAAEIRQMPPNSGRNDCLNRGAFRMGKMVASGWIDKTDVVDELSAAGIASGLDVDEVQRTLASGLAAGMQQPAADPKERPHVNGDASGDQSSPASTPIDWPDPVPLPTSLLPVAPFDYAMLPESVRPWVEDVTERMQSPPDYAAVTVMTALGSLIGRKIAVRPKLEDNFSVVPNKWGMLIGPPGIMKSPSQNEGLAPLKQLAAAAREAFALAGRVPNQGGRCQGANGERKERGGENPCQRQGCKHPRSPQATSPRRRPADAQTVHDDQRDL